MSNSTKLPPLSYFKFRYSCYLHILDFNSTVTFRTLYELEDETFEMVAGIFCFIFAVFIIVANLTFIYTLMKTNRVLSSIQKLFVYVSCVDLLTGFVGMPLLGLSVIRGLTCVQQAVMVSFVVFSVVADGLGMFTISCLRVRSIVNPLGSPKLRRQEMVAIMFVQDSVALIFTLTFFLVYIYGRRDVVNFQIVSYLACFFVITTNAGILICVSYTLYKIRQKEAQDGELSIMDKKRLVNQRKSSKTLLIIAFVMMFSMILQMPTLIILSKSLNDSTLLDGSTFIWTKRNADFTCFVSSLNTGFNSVILMARSKKIRQFLKRSVTSALTVTTNSTDSQGV